MAAYTLGSAAGGMPTCPSWVWGAAKLWVRPPPYLRPACPMAAAYLVQDEEEEEEDVGEETEEEEEEEEDGGSTSNMHHAKGGGQRQGWHAGPRPGAQRHAKSSVKAPDTMYESVCAPAMRLGRRGAVHSTHRLPCTPRAAQDVLASSSSAGCGRAGRQGHY